MSHERLMPNTSPCSQLKACQWHMMVTQPASKPPFSLLSHARVTFYKKIISLISHGTNPPHLAQRGANCQHVSGPAIY
ncbi:hypothetical protein COCHEDRAFT_1196210 [Bipolaris maydis C5]|uniref:Uncharacterized protein n=2 Tax=Cochliobolus heterostrophus TaxID=5016 RepID=M2UN14_COCH5|nr:hypothetical protein COCHEDRAFT_1196210 [Bipolaris maydis C5]